MNNKDFISIEPNQKNLEGLKLLIEQWAVNRNLHTADSSKQALKLGEEYGELCEGLSKGKPELIKDALGDMFVVMVILALQEGYDITECVEIAYKEIKDRKGKMVDGVFVKESDLTESKTLKETIDYVTQGKPTENGWFKGEKYL